MPNHFYALVDRGNCVACDVCAKRCPEGAIRVEQVALKDQTKCIGCGTCATGCLADSIRMDRCPEEEIAGLDAELSATVAVFKR